MLPVDQAHEKLQPQKMATPTSREKSMEDMAEDFAKRRMNAVVCERSSYDE